MKRNKTRPVIIGVTGSIGTGKSTVAAMFKALGAKVLDADRIAHRVIKKGSLAHRKIVKTFGRGVLTSSGAIDRSMLADEVFRDKRRLGRLCRVIHPEVICDVKKYIKAACFRGGIPAVVIDAPLLIEARMRDMTDTLVVVVTDFNTQVARVKKSAGLSAVEIKRRAKNQLPLKEKASLADYVIDNTGSKKDTKKVVRKIWKEIKGGGK